MDTSLNPISVKAEAMQILSYPDNLANPRRLGVFLAARIRSLLINQQSLSESPFVTEFRSGRRRYFCRAFLVGSDAKEPSQPSLAVLLERGPSEVIPLTQVSEQFNLTRREGEALEHLLQGLGSKEIANRMNISTNTVKAYLRLIMIKTGVSSRTAISWRVMMANYQLRLNPALPTGLLVSPCNKVYPVGIRGGETGNYRTHLRLPVRCGEPRCAGQRRDCEACTRRFLSAKNNKLAAGDSALQKPGVAK